MSMTAPAPNAAALRLDARPEFKALHAHAERLRSRSLRDLFAADPTRGTSMATEALGLHLDWSKQRVDADAMRGLRTLLAACGFAARREAMFSGVKINTTEHRAVLHTALRAPRGASIMVDGVNVVPEVHAVLDRMGTFADALRSGAWKGHTGKRIRHVINIGIGGSDLGPAMAFDALRAYATEELDCRFVSNIDANDFVEKTRGLDAAETLFIISSKTFTTLETMTNARTAREWSMNALGGAPQSVARHFVAVSTNEKEVRAFGIDPTNMFGFWDWVGGRYSMDSAIGLSTMIAVGPAHFSELLAGFHAMDEHFRTAPVESNLPITMALIGFWNNNMLGAETVAILPYCQYLDRFSAYLQQLEMESNGKHVDLSGARVSWQTCPVIWGQPGTNGQHAFYQMIHQGTKLVPCDFIAFAQPLHALGDHHDLLNANVFAQSQALAFGQTIAEIEGEGVPALLAPHKEMEGDRPSNVILCDRLTPSMLGKLIALYEHKVFTQGVLWGINSFDQWGVELGKVLAKRVAPLLAKGAPLPASVDSSTRALVERYRTWRDG